METKKHDAGVDVLYRVDPKKLSIKVCYTSAEAQKVAEYTTTFENFSYERVVVEPKIPEKIGKLPAVVKGVFYFRSEAEALDFIKGQIGL